MLISNMNLPKSKLLINTIIDQDYLILPHIDGLLLSLPFSDQYLQFSIFLYDLAERKNLGTSLIPFFISNSRPRYCCLNQQALQQ